MLLPFYLLDATYPGTLAAVAMTARTVWIATFAALAWRCAMRDARGVRLLSLAAGFVSGAATVVMVAASGGSHGAYFGYLYAIPFAVGVVLPDEPAAIAMAAAGVVVPGASLLVAEGRTAAFVLVWMSVTSGAGAVASYGSHLYRRLRFTELEAERQRAAAMEALARSERARHRAERLALLGRVAGAVGHEINNPLAVVVLRAQALAEGRVADPGGDEARRSLSQILAAARRIQSGVDDLLRLSQETGGAAECDAEEILDRAVALAVARAPGRPPPAVTVTRPLPRVAVDGGRLLRALEKLLVYSMDTAAPGAPVTAEARGDGASVTVGIEGARQTSSAAVMQYDEWELHSSTSGLMDLVLSRAYLAERGGSIEAVALPDGATRFVVRAPAVAAPPGAGGTALPPP